MPTQQARQCLQILLSSPCLAAVGAGWRTVQVQEVGEGTEAAGQFVQLVPLQLQEEEGTLPVQTGCLLVVVTAQPPPQSALTQMRGLTLQRQLPLVAPGGQEPLHPEQVEQLLGPPWCIGSAQPLWRIC